MTGGGTEGSLRLVVKGLEPLLVNPGVLGGVQTMSTVSFAVFGFPKAPLDDVVGGICRNTDGRASVHGHGQANSRRSTHPSSAGVAASAVGP